MTAFQVMIVFTMGHQLWWSQFRKVNGTWWINIFKDLINSNMHDNGITIMLKLCDSVSCTALKIKFFIKDFFSKCDQIWRKLRIWSHLLKKSLMENFIFCAVMFIIQQELDKMKSMWNTHYIRKVRNAPRLFCIKVKIFCILCKSNQEEEVSDFI